MKTSVVLINILVGLVAARPLAVRDPQSSSFNGAQLYYNDEEEADSSRPAPASNSNGGLFNGAQLNYGGEEEADSSRPDPASNSNGGLFNGAQLNYGGEEEADSSRPDPASNSNGGLFNGAQLNYGGDEEANSSDDIRGGLLQHPKTSQPKPGKYGELSPESCRNVRKNLGAEFAAGLGVRASPSLLVQPAKLTSSVLTTRRETRRCGANSNVGKSRDPD
ncbi:uncharacterized protein MAM_07443 [Metarhizium album ARSEF 1941]|uniref:Uncharacterized protein n=1 Tax=Metarhizium album (strain ARSEF 1941) TaxID=1081103 RepID=A0A0B2WL61_METAS|nr:uncharacterized protein MAM_07443 [Metarhizium album ARSEF 1941]KHN94688.1 hypothetical protein MAM_07443 [Metarhizium album ARSEF 1941]